MVFKLFQKCETAVRLRAEILQPKGAIGAGTFAQERAPGTSIKLQFSHFYDPIMSRVSPFSVVFFCALANGECCSKHSRYQMGSVMAELSAVRASGFRKVLNETGCSL